MPYITPHDRDLIDEIPVGEIIPNNAGELNYIITRIIHQWLAWNGVNYTNLNAAVGVLDCAKMELYRQIAAPYEDEMKLKNGPVSDLDE